jgi:hypothetical protein
MRNLILLFIMLSLSGVGQNKITFKLRKPPDVLETITTHSFFGNRNNTGFKNQNYDAPLFLKLYKDNTFLMFNSNLVGDSIDIVYHYFNNIKDVYRGDFELDSNGKFELNVIKGNLNCNFQLRSIPTTVGGTPTMKESYDFFMYKGALSRTYKGNVKPSLFPGEGTSDLLEMYPLDAYYKIITMSKENQDALELLYPELYENSNSDSTSTSSN